MVQLTQVAVVVVQVEEIQLPMVMEQVELAVQE
jgi:hypothetical protein